MSLGVQVNMSDYGIVRHLNGAHWRMLSSMEKLASGLAINRASDNPAMLIISERLRAQIGSLEKQIENLSAQELRYQYASSSAMQLRSRLTDLRSLAVAAANEGGNTEAAQQAYADEAEHIVSTYNHLIDTAEYNGRNLFDGSSGSLADLSALEGIDLSSAAAAEGSIAAVDNAVAAVDAVQIDLGATQKNRFQSEMSALRITQQNLVAAESQMRDLDYAREYSNYIAEMIKLRAGVALLAHSEISASTILTLLDR